jgi:hypothetical protein
MIGVGAVCRALYRERDESVFRTKPVFMANSPHDYAQLREGILAICVAGTVQRYALSSTDCELRSTLLFRV